MQNLCKFIDKNALRDNAQILKNCLGGKICAVLKSDAYGHGIKTVALAIKNFVDFFAVLNTFEAKQILDLKKPILVLEKPTKKNFEFAIKNNTHQVVFCKKDLEIFEKIAKKHNKIGNFHLKLNTGMNRMGVDFGEFLEIQKLQKTLPHLRQKGILTHFGSGFGLRSQKQFEKLEMFLEHSPKNVLCHFANSEISSFVKPNENQMARLGVAFFGYGKFWGLKPALSVFAKVVNVLQVKKGDFVGYGNKHKAKKDMTVAVLSIGYADGLLRSYHKKGFVILHDKKAKFVADICMNLSMVDVSKIPETKIDDFAIILGESDNLRITAEDVAKKCKTICYEILTNFSKIPVTNKKPVA